MTDESRPSEREASEAELLARALDHPREQRRDLELIDDALSVAYLLKAGHRGGLDELRARAILERVWPGRARWVRAGVGMAIAAALLAVAALLSIRPRGPAALPPPPADLLRAQIVAARPAGRAETAGMDRGMAAYREQVYAALLRTYGGAP